MLSPPDPTFRCRHCFGDVECDRLCRQCIKAPLLDAPKAFLFETSPVSSAWRARLLQEGDGALRQIAASLFIFQWERLQWPVPDRIAIVPNPGLTKPLLAMAQEVAEMLGKTVKKELKLQWDGPFQWRLKRCDRDLLENQSLLLIDFGSETAWLKKALGELWQACPSQIHIVSFFETLECSQKRKTP